MNYIKQNINHIRSEKNLSQGQLASLLDVSRDNIASYERGTEPKIEFIQRFVNYFHIKIEDFINTDLSKETINNPAMTNEFILRTDTREDNQKIPLYDVQAAAGLTKLFSGSENVIDYISIPNLPKCDGAIYIKGDSMYPLLKSGDIAIYKRIYDFLHGIFFGEMYLISILIDDEHSVVVKYVQKSDKGEDWVKLVSQNSYHADKEFPMNKITGLALIKATIRINSM